MQDVGDIFPDEEFRVDSSNKFSCPEEKSASLTVNASLLLARDRNVLARRTRCNNVDVRRVGYPINIAELDGVGEVASRDLKREFFNFTAPQRLDSIAHGCQLPRADTVKKTSERH